MPGTRSRSGFTLIEVLIVIAISAMLAGIAIGYSGVGRNQTALSVEETKISQFILQARTLAIATYGNTNGVCGYGVSFNPTTQTYSLFAYVPGLSSCPSALDITPASVEDIADRKNIRMRHGRFTLKVESSFQVSRTASPPYSFIPDPTTFLISGRQFGDLHQSNIKRVPCNVGRHIV